MPYMYVIQDPHANREKINQDLTSKHRITSYIVAVDFLVPYLKGIFAR